MSHAKEKFDLAELITSDPMEADAEHDAWVRARVRQALDEKKQGAEYADFRTVAAQFGFDAR